MFGTSGALDVDYSMTFGLKDPSGYDPPQPTDRYLRIWQLANPTQSAGVEWIVSPDLTPTGLGAMSLLGVRYILTSPTTPLPSTLPVRLVYKGSDALIFENPRALAPSGVPASVRVVKDEQRSLEAVSTPAFAGRREAVVESNQPGAANLQAGEGAAEVTREVNGEAVLRTNLTRGGLVVLNDAWARGWSVEIDGHHAQPLEVDDVMRGVQVPLGRHTVVWRYRVPGLIPGIVISLLAVLVVLCLGVRVAIARRRSPRPVVG